MFGSIANLVTFARLLLIPLYLFFFIFNDGRYGIVGLILLVVAIVTDWLDGYVARRTKITDVGVFFDPLADRLLIGSILVLLYVKGILPLWSIILILGRDVLIIAGHLYLTFIFNLKLKVTILGKITTAMIMISIISLIIGLTFSERLIPVGRWVFFGALFLSVISGLQYVKIGINALNIKGKAIEGVRE